MSVDVQVVVRDGAVLEDDVIDYPQRAITGVLVLQHRREAVGVAANLAPPEVGCEAHAAPVERRQVGGIQRADDVVSHKPVGGDDRDLRTASDKMLCGRQRRLTAVIVEDEHAMPR